MKNALTKRRASGSGKNKYSASRPVSPKHQINIIVANEEEDAKDWGVPSERDTERYYHYIEHGVPDHMLAPQTEEQREAIRRLIPQHYLTSPLLDPLQKKLWREVNDDYKFSDRKAIVNYILKDPDEKVRLHIGVIPKPYPVRTIRAPIPWHESYVAAKAWNEENLFITNPIMLKLQHMWLDQFCDHRFVRIPELQKANLPLPPDQFEDVVKAQCKETRQYLKKMSAP
ncbi:dynein axonemal heavy chain 3-like [Babylonia areolata]|uniref:dynein axonemal heavy chain 3-like n=1 Tax=Babylonia areolata TaxID=304850 RepID=UPI003FD2CF30